MPIEQTTRSDSALQGHLTDWRLSAGDEHLVFDASSNVLAAVPCGGMYRRSFDEATDVARLIVNAPKLLSQLEYAVKLLGAFPALNGTAQVQSMREAIAEARGVAA